MHHPTVSTDSILTATELAFLVAARTAVLAMIDGGGMPRLVPICFVAMEQPRLVVYSPLDEKPKRVPDPLLVDRWSEDWNRLGWLRLRGIADLVEPGNDGTADEHGTAIAALRIKYAQYASHDLEERPLVRIAIEGSRSWGNLGGG
jgi:PPOX class probable F420-dependent enzyme